ncbi:MAG: alanine racemase [Bacteroidota bacterium]
MHKKTAYYKSLNQELKTYHKAIPSLLLDLDRLDKNLEQLQTSLGKEQAFRIVVKSLPSPHLVQYIREKANTNKLMLFHQPFLSQLVKKGDEKVDILLGKPMPIKTVTYFYDHLEVANPNFDAFAQIQWLVDTEERIKQYIQLAQKLGRPLKLNIEIDVGLHRGGFSDRAALRKALQLFHLNKAHISFSGFMGYDPHVVKLPAFIRSQKKALQMANSFYKEFKELLKQEFPKFWSESLTFNGAGSPTMALHKSDSPLNDISLGSALVKPTTFDIPSLTSFLPASFIATPVLKKFEGTTLPGIEKAKGIFNFLSKKNRTSFFIYGGYWKADYIYPEGIQQNAIFGASTNQTMLNAPPDSDLEVDDFVLLRPHQSEFVFLQFGKILTVRNRKIIGEWEILKN